LLASKLQANETAPDIAALNRRSKSPERVEASTESGGFAPVSLSLFQQLKPSGASLPLVAHLRSLDCRPRRLLMVRERTPSTDPVKHLTPRRRFGDTKPNSLSEQPGASPAFSLSEGKADQAFSSSLTRCSSLSATFLPSPFTCEVEISNLLPSASFTASST
jgi:hypothetical protein